MKALFVFITLVSSVAFADEMPIEDRLESAGYNQCVSEVVYNQSMACGATYAQTFECNKIDSVLDVRVKVLAIGEIGSDVLSSCSPTRVIHTFVEGKIQ